MLALLTPKPFRGDVIAAGVLVLLTLVWCLLLRFGTAWAPGTHLAYATVAFVFASLLAVRAPMEGDQPRAYQSVLYLASVSLWAAVLVALSRVVGVHTPDDLLHAAALSLVALSALAFVYATRNGSAACTLVGALAAGLAVLALFWWVFDPDDVQPFRWVLLFETAVFALAAVGNRDRRPRHGVALANAAGLAVVLIGLTFVRFYNTSLLGEAYDFDTGAHHAGWGWELLILATGFGLIAYSSVDRQPGPAYVGLLDLILFTVLSSGAAGHDASLLGWPLVIAVAAALLLVVGLRPTTPAPPPPDIDAPEPPPLPWR